MTDLPDWTTQQQAGGIRYIGSVSVTIGGSGTGGGSLDVSLLPLDRSIIVVCPGRAGLTTTTVSVLTNDPAVSPALFSTSAEVSADPQPVNAYVSPAITSAWQVGVDMTGPPAGPYAFYVFVDSSVTHVAVDPGAASIPVGITSPAFGQGTMLQSIPVVIASDQSPVEVAPQGVGQYHATSVGTAVAGGTTTTVATFAGPTHPRMTGLVLSAVQRVAGAEARVEVRIHDTTINYWYLAAAMLLQGSDTIARDPAAPFYLGNVLDTNQTWTLEVAVITLQGAPSVDWWVDFDYQLTSP